MELQRAIGKNKTGTATAKQLTDDMIEGTREFGPSSPGDERQFAAVRAEYASEAEPVGSVPPPATAKQAKSTAKKAVAGERPTMLLDALGARLAFERTGVRLYEALLSKFDTLSSFTGGPSRADLEGIREDELKHFHMLRETIVSLGGDPTAVTPHANTQAVLSAGVPKILVDPRTTLAECLEAILTAELVDNDSWATLVDLASMAGEDALVTRFGEALKEEQRHLGRVRSWLAAYRSG